VAGSLFTHRLLGSQPLLGRAFTPLSPRGSSLSLFACSSPALLSVSSEQLPVAVPHSLWLCRSPVTPVSEFLYLHWSILPFLMLACCVWIRRLYSVATNERFLPAWDTFRVNLTSDNHWLQPMLVLSVH
jgi:hypothetical protein